MASNEKRLNRDSECGKCGGFLPQGTSLEGLEWNPVNRRWEHRGACPAPAPSRAPAAPAPAAQRTLAPDAPPAARPMNEAPSGPTAIATAGETVFGFRRDQVDLIKSMIARDATDDELRLFLYTASRYNLDPLLHDIYFRKYKSRDPNRPPTVSFQVGVDGLTSIAHQANVVDGIDEPVFGETIPAGDGLPEHPAMATVRVYRKGSSRPFVATARWAEYYARNKDGTIQGMWQDKPFLMLGKCALSRALRLAFPAEVKGLYSTEEMAQADNPLPGPRPPPRLSAAEKAGAIDAEATPSPPAGGTTGASQSDPAPAGSAPPAPAPKPAGAPPAPPSAKAPPPGASTYNPREDPAAQEMVREIEGMCHTASPFLNDRRNQLLVLLLKSENVLTLDQAGVDALDRIRTRLGDVA